MRLFVASALAALALTLAAEPAAAQSRQYREPFRATVKQRSFLDAGPVAPVGRYQNYVNSGAWFERPAYFHTEGRFGADTLPPRIGAGGSPFCCF